MRRRLLCGSVLGVALAAFITAPFAARAEGDVLDPATYQAIEAQIQVVADAIQKLAIAIQAFLEGRAAAPVLVQEQAAAPVKSTGLPTSINDYFGGLTRVSVDSGTIPFASAVPSLPSGPNVPQNLFAGPPVGFNMNNLNTNNLNALLNSLGLTATGIVNTSPSSTVSTSTDSGFAPLSPLLPPTTGTIPNSPEFQQFQQSQLEQNLLQQQLNRLNQLLGL